MTTPLDKLFETFALSDVHVFSKSYLGVDYDDLKGLIYPEPPYRTFLIRKKNGKARVINEPRRKLKEIQLRLKEFIEKRYLIVKPCVHAFTKGRSIVSNARYHAKQRPGHLLNIDLEGFFPSIGFRRIRGVFRKEPFNCSYQVATVLAQLCTFKDELPQGAPTSPILANLVCRGLDRDLTLLARRHRLGYTRYADDISLSFPMRDSNRLPANIVEFDGSVVSLGAEIRGLIEDKHNFRINSEKVRISDAHRRQEVTGLVINEFPNVRREFIDGIRGALHAWERFGLKRAQSRWAEIASRPAPPIDKGPAWDRQTRTAEVPRLENNIWGRILYVRMIRGKSDPIYTRLAEKYNELCRENRRIDATFHYSGLPTEPVVRNIADIERAVFVIEWQAEYKHPETGGVDFVGGQGTAFAFGSKAVLITCDHVLSGTANIDGGNVEVDIESPGISNLKIELIDPASMSHHKLAMKARDKIRDLAVLTVADPVSPVARYFGAKLGAAHARQASTLIGFPNWTRGRRVDMNAGRITNAFARAGLRRLEFSEPIRQGNSGGPLVDEDLQLIGIAQEGATVDLGNNECLAVDELDEWCRNVGVY